MLFLTQLSISVKIKATAYPQRKVYDTFSPGQSDCTGVNMKKGTEKHIYEGTGLLLWDSDG